MKQSISKFKPHHTVFDSPRSLNVQPNRYLNAKVFCLGILIPKESEQIVFEDPAFNFEKSLPSLWNEVSYLCGIENNSSGKTVCTSL